VAQVIQRAGGAEAPTAEARASERTARRRTTWREDAITAAFGCWVLSGGVADAYAHVHNLPDTFFTPWHGLLYSGFLAMFAWIGWISLKGSPEVPFARRIPLGYGLAIMAGVLVLFGAVGDGFWHTIFGIEVSLEALLSPTHQLVFLAMLVLLATPFRAAWLSTRPANAPGFVAFLPALVSLALTLGLITIYMGNTSPFRTVSSIMPVVTSAGSDTPDGMLIDKGFMNILVTNLLLMAPLLLVLRRWRPPFGTAAIVLSVPPAITIGIYDFANGWLLLATVAAGVVADRIIASRARDTDDSRARLLVAVVTPLVLWGGYFLIVQARDGITWSAELWSGSIVLSIAGSYGLYLLTRPLRRPQEAES
jgi:hypothetical protein